MAGETPDLVAHKRARTGKGGARDARRRGMVPAVVYGGEKEPLAIELEIQHAAQASARRPLPVAALQPQGGGRGRRARHLPQRAARRGQRTCRPTPTSLRLRRTSKVALFIPVDFQNHAAAPGIKRGGVLTVVRPEVELIVTAGDIPESITVDLTGLQIGDTITISSVTLPEGSKATIDRDFVIANITAPSGLRSSGTDAEEEESAEA